MRATKPVIGLSCSTSSDGTSRTSRRFHCPEAYVRRVEEAGGIPLLLPTTDPKRVPELLSLVDGVILIGGDDVDPSLYGAKPHAELGPVDRPRDEFELAIARYAAAKDLPALGICRGHQVMNVALGGTLFQHIPGEIPGAISHATRPGSSRAGPARPDATHEATITPGTRLHRLLGTKRVAVNSHHHQSVRDPADGFDVTARTGDGVVEAAEIRGHAFFLGVQWHPERMPGSSPTRRLFRAFLAAAAAHRTSRSVPRSSRLVRG